MEEGRHNYHEKYKHYKHNVKEHFKKHKKSYIKLLIFIIILILIVIGFIYLYNYINELNNSISYMNQNTKMSKVVNGMKPEIKQSQTDQQQQVQQETQPQQVQQETPPQAQPEIQPETQLTQQPVQLQPSSFTKSTPGINTSSSNVIELCYHDVDCGNATINRFKLNNNNDFFSYNYNCLTNYMPIDYSRYDVKSTPLNNYGDESTVYLDRHNVDCGPNSLLKEFKLNYNSGKINYVYSCLPTPNLDCYNDVTPMNSDGDGKFMYLDRHDVKCKDGYSLNKFKLYRDNAGNNYQYGYTCCK